MRLHFFGALPIAVAMLSGCSADDTPAYKSPGGKGGASIITNSPGSGGLSASTPMGASGSSPEPLSGSGGDMGGGGADNAADAAAMPVVEPPPSVCNTTTPTDPIIADFRNTNQTTGISFGDFAGGFSGYSYQYGAGITSDVSTGVWHLTGMVTDYSGFGLGFNFDNSHNADASGYAGVQFAMKGNVGPSSSLTLGVQNGPDSAPTTFSACSKCPGDCGDPNKSFSVGQAQTTVSLKWSDFSGGRPQAGVDPKQLLGLIWFFGWNGPGTAPYAIDLTIYDVKFFRGGADAAAE